VRNSKCLLVVIMTFFVFGVAFGASPGITVKAVKGYNCDLDVSVPNVELSKVQVAGKQAIAVSINGSISSYEKNAPALPQMSALVMIDPKKNPGFKISDSEPEIVPLDAPIVPSRGNFTRDIDPETVPFVFGDIYNQDKWYPADNELVKMDEPFIMRDIRGVRVLIQPVQYNPVKNQLRIHRKFSISINGMSGVSTNPLRSSISISKAFEPLYQKAFVNFDQMAKRLPRLNENGRLLIICCDAFVDAVMPFVSWKKKCGITVVLAKASEAGATAEAIKTFIQNEYNKGGLTNIMIVGDAEQVPTLKGVKEKADSDPCYTKLAGDDHVPDCIISRLSATTPEQVAYQVAKFINYEQFPITGAEASWYKQGTGIASNQGNPTDYARAGLLRDALLKAQFASIDEIYDPTATKAKIAAAVNEGRSLINYIGHGSTTSWGTTGYSNNDVGQLANGWKMPIIWSVACVNGNFVGKECFCEAWLKAGDIEKPRGAVAIFGASTNQEWVPPCDVQNEIIVNYTAKETYKTVGGLAFNGIIKGLEQYGTEPKGSGVMMFEQWHLFGDGTLLARFKEPQAITVKTQATKNGDNADVKVIVSDSQGKPISNARVCVYSEKVETSTGGFTNDQGEAALTLSLTRTPNTYVTVVGADIVPVVDQAVEF